MDKRWRNLVIGLLICLIGVVAFIYLTNNSINQNMYYLKSLNGVDFFSLSKENLSATGQKLALISSTDSGYIKDLSLVYLDLTKYVSMVKELDTFNESLEKEPLCSRLDKEKKYYLDLGTVKNKAIELNSKIKTLSENYPKDFEGANLNYVDSNFINSIDVDASLALLEIASGEC